MLLAVLLLDGALTAAPGWRWVAGIGAAAGLLAALGEIGCGLAAWRRR